MDKLSFDEEELNFIRAYQKAIDAPTIENAILNAISIAFDYDPAWSNEPLKDENGMYVL